MQLIKFNCLCMTTSPGLQLEDQRSRRPWDVWPPAFNNAEIIFRLKAERQEYCDHGNTTQWPCKPHTTAGIIWCGTQSQALWRNPTSLPATLTLELRSGPYLQYMVKWHCVHSSKSKQLLKMSCSLRSNFHLDKEFQLLRFNWVCNFHASFSWKLDIIVWGGETPG